MTSDNDKITFSGKPPACNECGIAVGFLDNRIVHMRSNGTVDQQRDEDHLAVFNMATGGNLREPVSRLYATLQAALTAAIADEAYDVAAKICDLLEQVTREISRGIGR